jgi:hypothetical protein
MSNADAPPPSAELPPPPRSGWLTALMVIIGVVLLLPGVCALVFGVMTITEPHASSSIMPFVVIGLLVGFGGIMLIRAAIRGPQR